MRRVVVPVIALMAARSGRRRLAAPVMPPPARPFSTAPKPPCKTCHTDVKSPLAKAGAENTADELKAWVRTPKDMIAKKGKKGTMPVYGADKISDADLENLVAYLATLK